jgi:Stress responsive A/B Barrel Domain
MFKMRTVLIPASLVAAMTVALAGSLCVGATKVEESPQVAHTVYFKLKDSSGANRAKLAASCKIHLTGHNGTVSFATGTLAGDLKGPYNDTDFDVSLHLVFVNKEALDKYHEHPRHAKFVEENKESFEKVRVFDAYLSPTPPGAIRRFQSVE